MIKRKSKIMLAVALSASFVASPLLTSAAKAETLNKNDPYAQKFLEMREKITDSSNGYYRTIKKDGKTYKIPYHSKETFLCEGPDYGHETTSETYSYYVWLEAMYGGFTGDWTAFNDAWDSLEKFMIPAHEDQPNNNYYKPEDPADYSNEYLSTSKYPSPSEQYVKVGSENLTTELKSAYGTDDVYGMHWLLDTDNWYKYGKHGKDGKSGYDKNSTDPVFINTYQRGGNESAFKTVTHPSWEDCKTYGDQGKTGFLGLFNGSDTHQWRYTIASDADARAVQATYWADQWAGENSSEISKSVKKASKLGDYLRYSMFDKYFRAIGCQDNAYASGDNKHYLLGWYYSWGGDTDYENWGGSWAWKIGCSHNHFGYQNPMTAWILSNDEDEVSQDFTLKSSNGKSDWAKSLDRQIELYQWLQSDEGAIAGGCTNSYTTDNGSYQKYPDGASTFYGMVYDEAPVYLDPPSNNWFGMQVWSLQRLAELYYKAGDERCESVLNKWADWAIDNTEFTSNGYKMPANLEWDGQPGTWDENSKSSDNSGLHVKIAAKTDADIGVAGSFANTLFWTAKANENKGNMEAAKKQKEAGEKILEAMWNNYRDEFGIAKTEEIDPAKYFDSEIFIPSNYRGVMGNGDKIQPGVKFIDIRSGYKNDPDYSKVKAAYDAGQKCDMTYHRYWAQVDAALAYGTHAVLWPINGEVITGDVILGDVNGDGKVDIADYTLLKRYINTGAGVKINEKNADVNKDGTISFLDLLALKTLV